MFGKFNRILGILIILFTLMIIIPSSFALNETDVNADVANSSSGDALQSSDDDLLAANSDYYFNSSNDESGDGSMDNPYRDLTTSRIRDYSTMHFASGEYTLNKGKIVRNVTFIGENSSNTIIRCTSSDTGIFYLLNNNYIHLANITIIGFNFDNYEGRIYAENVIFRDTVAPYEESSSSELVNSALNSRGGAIHSYSRYSPYYTPSSSELSSSYKYPRVYLENCTFMNNTAEYGGAIFADDALLVLTNCSFIDNYAYNYGGSVVLADDTLSRINNTSIFNSKSQKDAGGAIYVYISRLFSINLTIVNSSSTFGGAITVLNSTVELSNMTAINNTAKYDGGALYQMYGSVSLTDSNLINNSARNGGAIYVDDVSKFELAYNNFTDNYARFIASSVYAFYSHSTISENNTFRRNGTDYTNDIYEINEINLFIGDGNYTLFVDNSTFSGVLPSRYSSVEQGYVTPVTDQQDGGNCWAFGAMAALESSILKASGQCLDLSEGNMKNIIELYSDYGWAEETNDGGFKEMAIGYLVSWLGPVFEYQDEYDDYNMLSPVIQSLTHVQNVVYITRNSFTDNNAIKEAIMRYGAVVSGMYMDDDYYSESYYSYYYHGTPRSNHAVALVGWDDSYSRNNFIDTPAGNGAWIVKNSWDTDWGDEGYFYISYYDTSVARFEISAPCYAFVFNNTERYDKNYQYDIIGSTDYFTSNQNEIWVQNVFTATDDELLAAVSTFFRKTTDYELFIYVNDDLILTESGTCTPGYTTINLRGYVPLKVGDEFRAVFKLTSNQVEFAIADIGEMNIVTTGPGRSFVSDDGITWKDLYRYSKYDMLDTDYSYQVACIKAFTILYESQPNLQLTTSKSYNVVNIIATVHEGHYPVVYSGEVLIKVDGIECYVDLINSKAVLSLTFDNVGVYNVTASYNGLNASTTFNVDKLDMHLSSVLSVADDDVLIRLTSPTVSNPKVRISLINLDYPSFNKNYTVSLSKGEYELYLSDLGYGNYVVYVDALSGVYESHIQHTFKISVIKTRIIANDVVSYCNYDGNCIIQLTDNCGIPLVDCLVLVSVDDQSDVKYTDESGFISVNLKLTKIGNHTVNVIFYRLGDHPAANTTFNIEIRPTVVLLSSNYLSTFKIDLKLLDKLGNRLTNTNVNVVVDGVNRILKVDGSGKIVTSLTLKAGKHNIIVYNPVTNEKLSQSIIVVNRIMENRNIVMYYLAGNYYKIRVYGDNGKPISGAIVKIMINKKAMNIKTNSLGYVSFKISLAPGTYLVSATYKEYKVSNKIVVKPLLTAKNIVKKKAKVTKFSAKLVNTKGKAVKGKYLTFIVDGRKYLAKTNALGVATVSLLNLKVGKHIATTKYSGSTIKNTILIKN